MITLKDADSKKLKAENGVYTLKAEETYSYVAVKSRICYKERYDFYYRKHRENHHNGKAPGEHQKRCIRSMEKLP